MSKTVRNQIFKILKEEYELNGQIEEGWMHNLATGLALAAGAGGGLKAQSQTQNTDLTKPSIEQTQETQTGKIEKMVKVGQDKSIPDGYGVGSSPNMATAKKMAMFNARKNILEKGGSGDNLTLKSESLAMNQNGGYDYHIVLGK